MYGFEGWLLKVNGAIFPMDLIHADTYKITPDQETDIDDYTDNDGVFHRNILPAKATKIEFDIKPIRLADMERVKNIIPEEDSDLRIEYWNPKRFRYQSGKSYVPDIQYNPYMVYKKQKDILYLPTRIAFIEYGEIR